MATPPAPDHVPLPQSKNVPETTPPRVAFFTECFHEVNGVALTSRQYEAFAERHNLPFFSVHAAEKTATFPVGSVTRYELARGAFTIPVEADFGFDLRLNRYTTAVLRELEKFRPDVIHFTALGDIGILAARLAKKLGVPMAASWHTNTHEYANIRVAKFLRWLPKSWSAAAGRSAEDFTLRRYLRFYAQAGVHFAPNPELIDMLVQGTGRPCYVMPRGVNTDHFNPAKRTHTDGLFRLGYIGRLSPEKSVRMLARIEKALTAAGYGDFRIYIAGQGSEREWLEANLQKVEWAGVLNPEEHARAFANLDLYLFPSKTDTYGNVVLESAASRIPSIVTNEGGPKFLVEHAKTGWIAESDDQFVDYAERMTRDRAECRQMGENARQWAESRSWDAVFQGVYSRYQEHLLSS